MKTNRKTNNQYGIYIHIPFCERKCYYCDFLSAPSTKETKENYVQALMEEIKGKSSLISKENVVKTIFFGGGTPSLLSGEQIDRIMSVLKCYTTWNDNMEITIECNPGTVTKETLMSYKNAGINRISFGLQSTNNNMLKTLGRIHTYEQFLESYQMAREVGFTNINIDLMSGLPNERKEDWRKDLETIVNLNPPPEHISAYSLIIEPETPFFNRYASGEHLPEEEEERQMYTMTKQILGAYGYTRYEISNYAKEGFECIHNTFYWTGVPYIGFGIGASSYWDGYRFSNISNINTYINIWKEYSLGNVKAEDICFSYKNNKQLYIKKEPIDTSCVAIKENTQKVKMQNFCLEENVVRVDTHSSMEEFMFLGLRLMKGISKEEFFIRFQKNIKEVYKDVLENLMNEQLLEENGEYVSLTEKGIDVSNYVMAQFLLDE